MAQVKADSYGNLYIDNPWYISDVHAAAEDMGIKVTDSEAEGAFAPKLAGSLVSILVREAFPVV